MSLAKLSPQTALWTHKHLLGGVDFYHPDRNFFHEVCEHLDPAKAMREDKAYQEMRTLCVELSSMLQGCQIFAQSFTMFEVWPGGMEGVRKVLGRPVAPVFQKNPLDDWNSDEDDENLLEPIEWKYQPVRAERFEIKPGTVLCCHPNPVLHKYGMDYRRLVLICDVHDERGILGLRLNDPDKMEMDAQTRWQNWTFLEDEVTRAHKKYSDEQPFRRIHRGGPNVTNKFFCLHNLVEDDVIDLDGGFQFANSSVRFGRSTPDELCNRAHEQRERGRFLRLIQGGIVWKPGELEEEIRQGKWVLTQDADLEQLLGDHWQNTNEIGWYAVWTLLGEQINQEYYNFFSNDVCIINVENFNNGGKL